MVLVFGLLGLSAQAGEEDCPVEVKGLGLCAELIWTEGPHWGKFSNAELRYWDKKKGREALQEPSENLVVYPWMIMEMGEHGGRSPVVKKLGPGHLSLERFQFAKMPGHWEVRIRRGKDSERTGALAVFRVPLVD